MECHINKYIEESGYQKKYIATKLGVSQQVLSRWVNGKSLPSLENAFRLAEILNCKVDDLFHLQATKGESS